MEPDFGEFLFTSSSPPRQYSNLTHSHRDKPPNAFYRSASNLSPVSEGSETDLEARGIIGSNFIPDPVHVIATSVPPSKTFQMLTRGGIFEDPDDPWLALDDFSETRAHVPQIKEWFSENTTPDRNANILNQGIASPSLNNQRSPLTRPKMRNNNFNAGPTKPTPKSPVTLKRPTDGETDTMPLPTAEHSVEQAVHRERVNSLLQPSKSKTALKKISPPSVLAVNLPISRKISPPSETSNSKIRSQLQPPLPGKPAPNAASQNKLFTPSPVSPSRKPSPSRALLSGASRKISPPISSTHDNPKVFSQRYRRKSLPDIRVGTPMENLTTFFKAPSIDGIKSPSRQASSPRRKTSEH